MSLNRLFAASCAFVLVGLLAAPAQAQGIKLPWSKKVDADPKQTYQLSERDGPWLIMVGSFAGENAETQSRDLVMELRRDHNMKAYIYHHEFQPDEQVGGKGWTLGQDNLPVPVRMKLANGFTGEEYAVLVGDFSAADDAKAEKTLAKIKQLRPKCLAVGELDSEKSAFRQFRFHYKNREQGKPPLISAFVCPNPYLPDQYLAPKGPDKLVYEMNKDLEFSLLHCPSPYTLVVASFKGDSTLDANKIAQSQAEFEESKNSNKGIKSKLADAADKAHRLTEALRAHGYEAYEYHDRYESVVCIGGFDALMVQSETGQPVINPDIARLGQQFQPQLISGKMQGARGNQFSAAWKPFTLPEYPDIPFDYQPYPREVPRYSVASDYARGATPR